MLTEDTNYVPLNNLDTSGANGQPNSNLIATDFWQPFPDNFQPSGSFSTPTLEEIIIVDGTEIPENFSATVSSENYRDPLIGNLAIDSDDSLMKGFLPDNEAVLEVAVSQAQEQLESFTSEEEFFDEFNQAFNLNVTSEEAQALIKNLVNGETLPKIEIVSARELNNAEGAFGEGTIYVSEELLGDNVNNPEAVTKVLLEEMGHFVDEQLSSGDSPGDEGDIFARLVRNETIAEAELATLKAEDDSATIELDGEEINLELSESRTPYTIESGDTLSQIAQNELGDGTLWTTIEKEDGTTFTEEEATTIQPGQVIYLPGEISSGEQPEPSPPDELTGNFRDDIVTIANQEWEFFDGGNLQETEEGAWQRVVEYWETPGIDNILGVDSPEEVGDSDNPWS
ncbi:MAG TPA: hypothetical protein ACFCUY_04420, partial [Xenococcaceae cyanobacterium]